MEWTVLIIDDEESIRRTLKNYLMLSDYRVLTAAGGEAALAVLRQEKVHIALCDIKMPGMDGIETLEMIRKLDFSIQVIMMSGYSTFDYVLRALQMGATDYIQKPFPDLADLIKLIEISTDRLSRWKRVLAGSSGNPT